MSKSHRNRSSSWDPVANWYIGWVGKKGSTHHRRLAIPTAMELLDLQVGERLLELGCGPGVLAPHVANAGALYTGVDLSSRLLRFAERHHRDNGRFLFGDATQLQRVSALHPNSFDAAIFLLSVQDIDPLEDALASANWALDRPGRIVLLMTHPCFRVPWHSGWDWDADRNVRYRRIERYRQSLAMPMKEYTGSRRGSTRTYHRPLETYVNGLAREGFAVDRMIEVPSYKTEVTDGRSEAEARANNEIPLFLGIRAVSVASD